MKDPKKTKAALDHLVKHAPELSAGEIQRLGSVLRYQRGGKGTPEELAASDARKAVDQLALSQVFCEIDSQLNVIDESTTELFIDLADHEESETVRFVAKIFQAAHFVRGQLPKAEVTS